MTFDHKRNRQNKKNEGRGDKRMAKINAKNAFDVNVDYLDKLPHLLKKNEETSWQKASASLDASAKIYGYRVDSVHSETFKFLGGLSRAEAKDENEGAEEERKEKRERRHDGFSTLEKDIKKLDLVKYDLEFEVDPLFKSMTVKFAESGARGLLLNNLPLDSNLDVLLESKDQMEQNNLRGKYNNLQERDENVEISEDIRGIIDNTLAQFSIHDIKSIQICPDLSYFKKARELETSLEKTFYNNLMHEFDETLLRENLLNPNNISNDSMNDSMNLADNFDNDNLSVSQRTSSLESGVSANFEENVNLNMMNISHDMQKMVGASYMEGFSYLKSDDIKEYIQQFGDGNREIFKNMPHYKNFTKSFNQLDKMNNNLLAGIVEKERKPKKEETLFEFSVESEVNKNEIFEKESKMKKNVIKEDKKKDKKNKRRVRGLFFYDKLMLQNLFSIQDRHINTRNMMDDYNNDVNAPVDEANPDYGDDNGEKMEEEKVNEVNVENFAKFDNEYEKKFGRLYKTFDVRVIKNRIWDSISDLSKNITANINSNGVDFKKIIGSVSGNLSKEVLNNITTPTCFVCLLHLSNEKNLILEQTDEENFTVRTEK